MRFSEFSKYLERLEATSSRLEITKILAELLSKLESDEIEAGVFLSLGDLGPRFANPDTGISEKMMIRVLARAYSVSGSEVLKTFKAKGDLGRVAQELGSESDVKRSTLNVEQVFQKLLEVTEATGTGSQERKIVLLSTLIKEVDPLSCRYVARIPLGTMRLGFSEKTILEALVLMDSGEKEPSFAKGSKSREIKEKLEGKFNAYPNIGEVARVFRSKGLKGLDEIRLRAGVPVSPMLCGRLDSAAEMIAKMGKVAGEYKYDGTRLQIHLNREAKGEGLEARQEQFSIFNSQFSTDKVKMFTRNFEQMQSVFPDVVEAVLKEVKAKEAILDSEVVGYDPKTGKFLPFQETIQRKRKYDIAEMSQKIPVKCFVFDILYKDGQELIDWPLSERRKALLGTVKVSTENKLRVTDQLVTDEATQLKKYFDEARSKGLEGLVVKKANGGYEAGNRGFNWVKFKREEDGNLSDTIDCVVLGYYKGTGKRTGFGIGAFLVGVYDEKNNKILTVAKIGTGLTDEEWRLLKVKSDKLKVKSVTKGVEIKKELIPDVLCQPKIVVAIRADEITVSPSHSSGYALRFPRMMGYRTDKSPKEATTLKEIRDLHKRQRK